MYPNTITIKLNLGFSTLNRDRQDGVQVSYTLFHTIYSRLHYFIDYVNQHNIMIGPSSGWMYSVAYTVEPFFSEHNIQYQLPHNVILNVHAYGITIVGLLTKL